MVKPALSINCVRGTELKKPTLTRTDPENWLGEKLRDDARGSPVIWIKDRSQISLVSAPQMDDVRFVKGSCLAHR